MKKLFFTISLLCSAIFTFSQSSNTSVTSTESSTVSINDNNQDYTVFASFAKVKMPLIKSLITDAIGKAENTEPSLVIWNLKQTYTVTLKPEKLMIELNKDKATGTLIKTFERLSQQLQRTLSMPKPPATP